MIAKNRMVEENELLKQMFADHGLKLSDVWYPTPDDPELENRQLRGLLKWVKAYMQTPSRRQMEKRGYQFPPVEPDIDPDSDWIRFERWINGKALSWKGADITGQLKPVDRMTDREVAEELERVAGMLAGRGVVIDLHEGIPHRLVYEYLRETLVSSEFEFMGPGTRCHLNGCDGYCPGCFQRPWCDTGQEEPWPEDIEAGQMVVPGQVHE